MRALLTTGHGGRERLVLRDDYPEPVVGDGQVLVAIEATAINYHDIFTRRGMPGIRIPMPLVVGSDIAGTIRSVGRSVSGWVPGQRVLIDPVFEHQGKPGLIGETCDGGRAELISVPADLLISVPSPVTAVQAAALPLAYGTAFRMLVTRGSVAAGETVLVLGASGGVGAACVQIARALGAEVIACASSDSKLARLEEAGAHHLVNYASQNFASVVRERFGKPRAVGGGGVDVAVNFTGGDTILDTQKCVTKGGRILCCGATAGHDLKVDARYWWTFEHSMIGSDGWTREDLVTLVDWVATGKLAPLIDRTLGLEEGAEGERLLEDREVVGKVVLCP